MTQVWVKTNAGDIMRLGDAQKARKKDAGLTYEIVRESDAGRGQADNPAAARLHPNSGAVKSDAVVGSGPDGRTSTGGEHPNEDVGGVGEKTRRKRGRPRRDAGSRA